MRDIQEGMLPGLVATTVLSLLMISKAMMGLVTQLDPPATLAGIVGSPEMSIIGWIPHFVIGIVAYGVAIAALDSKLKETSGVRHGSC